MNILIIEDEILAAEKLQSLLKEVLPESNVLKVIASVEESIDWLKNNDCPDLILSDIHLNDGICFNIYSEVKMECPIIFTTAYEKYAIQAFEVNSIDYLLKPIQKERLEQALEKYQSLSAHPSTQQPEIYSQLKSMLSVGQKEYKARFLCKLGNKIKSIPVENIQYFYSESKLTFIVDSNSNRLPINNTLDEIDNMLDPMHFFRVNRKYIASYKSISEIHPYFKGRLKIKLSPATEDDIVVSTEKSPLFKAWLDR